MGQKARLARIALGMILIGGALSPGGAQLGQSSLTLNGRTFSLSGIELDRLTALAGVVHTANRGAQDNALAAARSVANTPDARYVLAIYQLEIGRQRQDDALRAPALDVLIADRDTPRDRLVSYLAVRGDIALRNHDYPTASALWTRLRDLQPNDPQGLVNLAQVRAAQDDPAGAIGLIRDGIAAHRSGPSPEGWYRQWLTIAHNARLVDQGAAAAFALLASYPNPANWRFALVAYRQLAAPQEAAEIDLLRLIRTAGALAHSDEYQRLTQLLLHAGLAAEARAVLDEGVSRGIVDGTESPIPDIRREIDRAIQQPRAAASPLITADTRFAEGRFAEAAAAYQAALQPARPDGAAVNLRLAVAFARAGRRAEAETILHNLAGGAEANEPGRFYPDLARFWLLWLAQSG
jgi:predicted Zn-dependent protease